jgi:3-oxoadipate enol-lactonase
MLVPGKDITVRINNALIVYDDYGSGEIPVIFIHGFPFNKSMWHAQLEFLKSSCRVIAYDIRGYGESTAGTEKASMTLYADDLVNFMDALQISKAVICGLSMGGYIALNAVNRYPDRFQSLILCDTQCIADTPEGREKRYKSIELIESGGIKEYTEGFLKNIFCKESLEKKPELVDFIRKIVLSTTPSTISGTHTALAERWESCSSLESIQVSVLIMCGKEDVITPPVQSEYLKKHISNSTLKIIDRAGHMSNLEQTNEFNEQVGKFLTGVL